MVRADNFDMAAAEVLKIWNSSGCMLGKKEYAPRSKAIIGSSIPDFPADVQGYTTSSKVFVHPISLCSHWNDEGRWVRD